MKSYPWLLAAFTLCAFPEMAHAYIDPGTGSMLLQSFLAAIAAGLVFGRTIWHRVKGFFTRAKSEPSDTEK